MRGYIKKRSKGSHSLAISMEKDPNSGNYKYTWITVRGNKTDAEKRLAGILHGVNPDFGIDAVIVPVRDSLSGIPYERQVFLHVCKENNVEIIPVHGEPILTDVNGSLVEHVLMMSKKIQVKRESSK